MKNTEKTMAIQYTKNGSERGTVVYYLTDGTHYKKVSPMQWNTSGLPDTTDENSSVYDNLIWDLRNKNCFSKVVSWNKMLNDAKEAGEVLTKQYKYWLLRDLCN